MRRDQIDDPFPDEYAHPATFFAAGTVAGIEHTAVGADARQVAPGVERVEDAADDGDIAQPGRALRRNVEQQQPPGHQER